MCNSEAGDVFEAAVSCEADWLDEFGKKVQQAKSWFDGQLAAFQNCRKRTASFGEVRIGSKEADPADIPLQQRVDTNSEYRADQDIRIENEHAEIRAFSTAVGGGVL